MFFLLTESSIHAIYNRMTLDTSPNVNIKHGIDSGFNAISYENECLRSELDTYKAEIEKLRAIIAALQRHRFGRRSEKIDPNQLALALEEIEQALATTQAENEAKAKSEDQKDDQAPKTEGKSGSRPPRNNNRGALPPDLPREHHFIEPEDKSCPCCGGQMHVIGEDVAEQLHKVPATLIVKVTHRSRYGCRGCEEGVVQAPAPERPIPGGLPTEALLADIVLAKYGDHMPLYRQAARFAREGIKLDRQTLCDWAGRTAWWFKPVGERLLADILASPVLFADDTTLPVLEPGRGRTKTGRLWAYARDERPWGGDRPPAVAYIYEEDRGHDHVLAHLAGFTGILHCDAYAAYDGAAKSRQDGSLVLTHCNVHARRNFYEIFQASKSPIAAEALRRYAELYAIEDEIRGAPAEQRMAVRTERSKPLFDAFEIWMKEKLALVSGKSELAKALRYALGRWTSLGRFLTDGRLEMDTNTVERAHRPQKLTVKNSLFAGSNNGARTWALFGGLIETCKLNGIEPFAYLRDTLIRMVAGHPINRIDELLPWNYRPIDTS